MNLKVKHLIVFIPLLSAGLAFSQDYEIQTLFKNPKYHGSGGYGAISNKFTRFRGEYANMAELYGGWYINHKFLLGIGVAALTNNVSVPAEHRTDPELDMNYQYAQFGLMTEYTLWSHRAIHLSFHVLNGAGFTVQYEREHWDDEHHWDNYEDREYAHDTNWFYVTEPGIKIEMNVFRWMRFSPGISYRASFGSDARGLRDSDINGISANVTLKFGKF